MTTAVDGAAVALRPIIAWVLASLVLGLTVSGCSSSQDSEAPSDLMPSEQPSVSAQEKTDFRLPSGSTWHWQLDGKINTSYWVDAYDIDLFDAPQETIESLKARGVVVICYFSAGSYEPWRADAASFLEEDLGKPLEGFAEERWLDIRSVRIRQVMLERLDLAQTRGCDAVEPDNMDAYEQDSGFALNANDQLAYNRFVASAARERALGVGLKNDLSQVDQLVDDFDFAVNEQCHQYGECQRLQPFIAQNKAVLNAEYESRWADSPSERSKLCAEAINRGLSTLVLPEALDDRFRYSCP